MKSYLVNLIVPFDFRLCQRAVVDAQGMIEARRSAGGGNDVEAFRMQIG